MTRHWARLVGAEVQGTDYNPSLVRWCAANLPFDFSLNRTRAAAPVSGRRLRRRIRNLSPYPPPRASRPRMARRASGASFARAGPPSHDARGPLSRTAHDSRAHRLRGRAARRTVGCSRRDEPLHDVPPAAYIAGTLAREFELLEHDPRASRPGRRGRTSSSCGSRPKTYSLRNNGVPPRPGGTLATAATTRRPSRRRPPCSGCLPCLKVGELSQRPSLLRGPPQQRNTLTSSRGVGALG